MTLTKMAAASPPPPPPSVQTVLIQAAILFRSLSSGDREVPAHSAAHPIRRRAELSVMGKAGVKENRA